MGDGDLTTGRPTRPLRPAATDKTDANGNYVLALSVDGGDDYVICEELQAGWTQSLPDPGTGDATRSPAPGTRGIRSRTSRSVTTSSTVTRQLESAATVSGMKFRDVDSSDGDFETPSP